MNIVVLAGGISTERDVSLSSGTKVCAALRGEGHNAILLDVFLGMDDIPQGIAALFTQTDEIKTVMVAQQAPDLAAVRAMRGEGAMGEIGKHVLEICRAADIVYMGLHGENGENGRLQAMFDVMEIPYTGTGYLGSALAMNKWITKELFLQNDIVTAAGLLLKKGEDISVAESLGLPVIVKPVHGGSSIGVFIAQSAGELSGAIRKAFQYEDEILVEKYVRGREFSVGILGNQVLPVIEIIPKSGFYDYANKYQPGWTKEVCPAQLEETASKMLQDAAMKVFKVLQLDVYGRVDFILEEGTGKPYCLEANTLPGMTPTSLLPQEAAQVGLSYGQLCQKIIELSLEKYR
ncbi:MAG: D-alanine--D-alanine ligase family protein [Christensenellales bacterium]|jgi:D-alanine-D-alanine ligase